jgi:hypothetical protein
MTGIRIVLGLCAVTFATPGAPAQHLARTAGTRLSAPAVSPAGTPVVSLIDVVEPKYRTDVASVMAKPTITARHAEEPFAANPTVYQWLLEHPDRAAVAWERIGVPCLPIRERAPGVYEFKDENGSDVSWQAVGSFAEGRVWFASGKVKPGALMPTVPVKAVVVARYPNVPQADGTKKIAPTASLYFQTDSRAAATVLRIAGPAAPRMAEDGAEQMLFFFSGLARYLDKHPDQTAAVLTPTKRAAVK